MFVYSSEIDSFHSFWQWCEKQKDAMIQQDDTYPSYESSQSIVIFHRVQGQLSFSPVFMCI